MYSNFVTIILILITYVAIVTLEGKAINESSEEIFVVSPIPESEEDDKNIVNNCYDIDGNGYTELLPHPFNCGMFIQCWEIMPGVPQGIVKNCPSNLLFSLESCNCNYEENTLCFNINNPDHTPLRLKCAKPIE